MSGKKLEKIKKIIIACVIFAGFICMLADYLKKTETKESKEGSFWKSMGNEICRNIEKSYFLLPSFLQEGKDAVNSFHFIEQAMADAMPLYSYALNSESKDKTEDESMAEIIMKQEGADEDTKNIEESHLDYGEDALHIENSMMEEMQKENSKYKQGEMDGDEAAEDADVQPEEEEAVTENQPGEFEIPEYPAYTYDWSENWGYEELVSNFYAVDKTTSLKEEYMNLDTLLYEDLSVDKTSDGPQILIYHTHSQEAFADSAAGDASTTIVGAGDKLARLLEEEYGFKVMHHTGEYDVEDRDYAYSNSLPALEKILEENPSIEVIIDLHRDAVKEGNKLVMDLNGRPTARFMFFNGMSYIRNKGDITYLENPYIQDNLAFSFQAQVTANEYYPGIARKIYLKAYRYNLHLKPKSMLIELGAQTNTVEEIMNACDPLAHIISIVLGG